MTTQPTYFTVGVYENTYLLLDTNTYTQWTINYDFKMGYWDSSYKTSPWQERIPWIKTINKKNYRTKINKDWNQPPYQVHYSLFGYFKDTLDGDTHFLERGRGWINNNG